jgi:hypothetical protein
MTIIAPLTGVNAGLNEALVYRKTIVKSKITHSKKKIALTENIYGSSFFKGHFIHVICSIKISLLC